VSAGLALRLVARLEREGIESCHWKGAAALERGLRGERDLDFLVPPEAFARTEGILADEGWKAARARFGTDVPGTAHFFGHEPGLERLLHVHLHDRVWSGEDLVPSHALPFARALLESTARAHGVRVPTPAQEAALAVLKHAVRWGSLPDLALAALRPKPEAAELGRALTEENVAGAVALVRAHCPAFDEATFRACAASLRAGRFGPGRVRLARRARRALRPFARQGGLARHAAYARLAVARARRLLDGERRDKALRGPGVRIAFVGGAPEARAALVAETARWLGQAFAVRTGRAPPGGGAPAGEIVLVDGEPAGRAPDLRVAVAESGDRERLRARIWEAL